MRYNSTTVILSILIFIQPQYFLPIKVKNRTDVSQIQQTEIGEFGLPRKARKNVPAHLHTGIDIKRPSKNYINEPIYPIADGRVISKRTDGPYAEIIIEHNCRGIKFWSLYEHIAGISVNMNELVKTTIPLARFMNKSELDKYGWQFDHVHLEILKIKPQEINPDKLHPERFFKAYSLICYTKDDLNKYYYNPRNFLNALINNSKIN